MKKLKIMPLLTGTLVAAAIAVTPLAALAQAQGQGSSQPANSEIVLSAEQEAKFKEIRLATLAQIQKVLTPDQMTQFKKEGPMGVQNLSDGQKTELQKIFEDYIGSIRAILTTDQLQQLEQAQPKK